MPAITSDSASYLSHAVHGEYNGTNYIDGVGIYGRSVPQPGWGYGGRFEGGWFAAFMEGKMYINGTISDVGFYPNSLGDGSVQLPLNSISSPEMFDEPGIASQLNSSNIPLLADAVAAPLALAQAVGRLGCFAAGCCYGVPGRLCAVTFTDPVAAAQTGVPLNIPLVLTQLIQMGSAFVLGAILSVLWRRKLEPAGAVFWWYVLLYSLTRGVIEFWRGDSVRGVFFHGHASTSQLSPAAAGILAAAMLMRGARARRA